MRLFSNREHVSKMFVERKKDRKVTSTLTPAE